MLFIAVDFNLSITTIPEGYSNDRALKLLATEQACLKEPYHVDLPSLPKIILLRILPFACKVHENGWISGKAQAGTACRTEGLDDKGWPKLGLGLLHVNVNFVKYKEG